MDTIRCKIYTLHAELSEALFSSKKAEEESESNSQKAKDLEIKQRELMKAIANKENDLDKVQDELERVQKLTREKERLMQQATEDKRTLTGDLACKEQELRRLKEALDSNAAQTQSVTTRSDNLERGRKEMEHRVMSYEDNIEALEAKIKEARYLTDEATRKHDEVTFKTDKTQIALNKAMERAERAERHVDRLETDLKHMSGRLTQKLAAKEKGMRKEENLKKQMRYMGEQLKEADLRADAEEEEVGKLELRAGLITERIRAGRAKMAQVNKN